MANRKTSWGKGTIFLVPLADKSCGVGQVITCEATGTLRIAVFPWQVPCDCALADIPPLRREDCISLLAVFKYALDKGLWRTVGEGETALDSRPGANWKTSGNQWVGSEVFTDNVVDALMNAYHGLEPWDDFADPEFLDKLLLPPHERPPGVKLTKSN
jgi:hypothetical protein